MNTVKQRKKSLLIWGSLSFIFCSSIYLVSNFLASKQNIHYPIYLEFERSIPLIPWMIYVYISLGALLILNLIILKNPKVIKRFAICLMVTALIAGTIFVLFPGKLGFHRTIDIPGYSWIFSLLHKVDQPFNLYPSLHICYSYLTVSALIDQTKNKLLHVCLMVWLLLIGCSVVLVHQHHLFDIFSGLALGILVFKLVYKNQFNRILA